MNSNDQGSGGNSGAIVTGAGSGGATYGTGGSFTANPAPTRTRGDIAASYIAVLILGITIGFILFG